MRNKTRNSKMFAKIVGSGLSGITCAIMLREKGWRVEIFEIRSHIGGNCYDSYLHNTLIHNYGPHIFHTNDEEVFSFLSRYTEWFDFKYQPKGNTKLGEISLPYSRKTVRELGRELSQEEIIEYIFKDYSEKQWGVPFDQIPSWITNRIPKTANCEDPTWFEGEKYQCLPKQGYTVMMNNMLDGIKVHLNCGPDDWRNIPSDLTIYSGKIDEYFRYVYGPLPYRSLEFMHQFKPKKLNHHVFNQNNTLPITRIYDHSYFQYQNKNSYTVITKEFPVACTPEMIPFYPMPFGDGPQVYEKYRQLAESTKDTIFIGRLGTYKYLDMWVTVKAALNKIKLI